MKKRVEMYYYPAVTSDGKFYIFRHWDDIKKVRKKLNIIDFVCCGTKQSANDWIQYYTTVLSSYTDEIYPVCYTLFRTLSVLNITIYGYIITFKSRRLDESLYIEKHTSICYPAEGYIKMMHKIINTLQNKDFHKFICIIKNRKIMSDLTGWSRLIDNPYAYRKLVRNFWKFNKMVDFRLASVAKDDIIFVELNQKLESLYKEVKHEYGYD